MDDWDTVDSNERTVTIDEGKHCRIAVRKVDGSFVQVFEVDTRAPGSSQVCIFVRRPLRADAVARATTLVTASPGSHGWALVPGEQIAVDVIVPPEDRPSSMLEGLADQIEDDDAACARLMRRLKRRQRLRAIAALAGVTGSDVT